VSHSTASFRPCHRFSRPPYRRSPDLAGFRPDVRNAIRGALTSPPADFHAYEGVKRRLSAVCGYDAPDGRRSDAEYARAMFVITEHSRL